MLVQVSPALAKATIIGFQGTAYGTSVNVGNLVKSGRSALSTIGCTSTVGVTHTNTSPSVSVPGVLSTGTINTSAASIATDTGVASRSTTTIQAVNALNGAVTADAVTSESTTSRDNTTGAFSTSAAGTVFTNLKILGVPVTIQPAPNTKITLPGIGYVILNQQTAHVSGTKANLTVIGIHVVVTLGAAAGTQVVVSFASSGLGGPVNGLLSGLAYGAKANLLSGLVLLGKVFPQPLGCLGTGGVVRENGGALVGVAPLVFSGTVLDTAEGINNHKKSQGETSSTIQTLSIPGLLTADAVKADVTAVGNPPTLGDNSSFVNLVLLGTPVSGTPAPNTKISLAGIGTLWLHRVFKTANSIHVIMIQLMVTVPSNPLGLAPGTTVNVASAQVGIGS